jgi:hypothetical protein
LLPDALFKTLTRKDDIIFTRDPNREWLWWSKVGYQKIAMVICRDLPIEKRFYKWLLFAPSNSNKWRDFVRQLRLEGETELLELAESLRPEDFNMAVLKRTAAEIWEEMRRIGALTPEVEAQLERERDEAIQELLLDLDNREDFQIDSAIKYLTDEQLTGLINDLSFNRLTRIAAFLERRYLERMVTLAQEPKKKQLLQMLLEE